jgi:plasmid maintenance system antidote protein VapI
MKNSCIGEAIKQKMQERGLRVCDFAKAIHCNRTNVYSIFTRKSIAIEQLLRISKVLNYDFVSEYCLQNEKPKKHLIVAEVDEQQLCDLLSGKSIHLIYSKEIS